MALLRHVHLPYSVASDEKLLETSHGLGTGGPAASHHRALGGVLDIRGRRDFSRFDPSPGEAPL